MHLLAPVGGKQMQIHCTAYKTVGVPSGERQGRVFRAAYADMEIKYI